jgi:threonine dehydratase
MTELPTFADVEAAAARIAGYATETPLIENIALNARAGARILIKPETLQRTGSFKFRGALNRILLIPELERRRGVVAFSSGNHAQGVAAAAALLDIPAVIVMPEDAPSTKIAGTRSYGAEVIFYDRMKGDREAIAAKVVSERGVTLVRPFDDAWIVAGQGPIGLEIAKTTAARGIVLDAVVVPAGGGGIVSGIALALSGTSPRTKVISAEPENFDGMRRSLAAGARTRAPASPLSVADSLMSPMPGEIPFGVARKLVSHGVAVSDRDMMEAVAFAARQLKLVVEPGGAAALAAVLSGAVEDSGDTIAIVLTGGNCDPATLSDAFAIAREP